MDSWPNIYSILEMSWVHLKRMCMLLLWVKYSIYLAFCVKSSVSLFIFCLVIWLILKMGYCYTTVYLSFQFCQFLLHIFWSFVTRCSPLAIIYMDYLFSYFYFQSVRAFGSEVSVLDTAYSWIMCFRPFTNSWLLTGEFNPVTFKANLRD